MPLEIEGGDGEKTLVEVEKTFICWHKCFIIILGVSLSPLPHHRFCVILLLILFMYCI